jgi:type I restriction enzyme, S subunit
VDYGYTASATPDPVGPKFLRITDIRQPTIDWSSVPHVEIEDSKIERYRLHPGDVVVARTGAFTGANAFVADPSDSVFASYLVRLRTGSRLHSRFAYYFMQSHWYSDYVAGVLGGSAQPNASAKALSRVVMPVPPIDEQRRIAAILGALDDKIELNRKMNRTLEEMAQAIFKSWFIDFDDVPDSEMVESELGPIPKGWEVRPLSTVIELAYGKSLPAKKRTPGPVPVYGSGGIGGYHTESLVDGPGIIVGRKGSVGTVYWEEQPFFPIDTTFYVKPRLGPEWLPWVHFHLDRMDIQRLGSDSAVPGVNRNTLLAQKVVVPLVANIDEFLAVRNPLRMKMQLNADESRTIAELRDSLLPKLISGEIRVPETEQAVEHRI